MSHRTEFSNLSYRRPASGPFPGRSRSRPAPYAHSHPLHGRVRPLPADDSLEPFDFPNGNQLPPTWVFREYFFCPGQWVYYNKTIKREVRNFQSTEDIVLDSLSGKAPRVSASVKSLSPMVGIGRDVYGWDPGKLCFRKACVKSIKPYRQVADLTWADTRKIATVPLTGSAILQWNQERGRDILRTLSAYTVPNENGERLDLDFTRKPDAPERKVGFRAESSDEKSAVTSIQATDVSLTSASPLAHELPPIEIFKKYFLSPGKLVLFREDRKRVHTFVSAEKILLRPLDRRTPDCSAPLSEISPLLNKDFPVYGWDAKKRRFRKCIMPSIVNKIATLQWIDRPEEAASVPITSTTILFWDMKQERETLKNLGAYTVFNEREELADLDFTRPSPASEKRVESRTESSDHYLF